MSKPEFDLLYTCSFTPSEKYIRLHDIAKHYHEQCEAFDKTICKWNYACECYMPTNHFQRRSTSNNARKLREYIFITNSDIDPKEIKKAISNYQHRETPP